MRITEFCTTRVGHSFRKRLIHIPGGTTNLIHPRNISEDGTLKFAENEPMRTDTIPRNPLKPGEILVQNKGRFAAALFSMPEPECWAVPSSVIILTITGKAVLPQYIVLYINSPKGQKKLELVKELSSIPFVTRKNLEKINIPIPGTEKQRQLISMNRTIREYRIKQNRKTEILIDLLNSELE